MSLENIKKEIEQKAASVEKEILAKAQQQVKEMQKKTAIEIHELEQEAQKKFEGEMALLKARELSMTNMEAKKRLFDVRKTQIAKAYGEAQRKIESMPGSERSKLLSLQLDRARKQISVETVYTNKADGAFLKGVKVSDMPISGGIICETADASIRVDYSFPTLSEQTKEKTLAGLSKKLFE